MFHIDTVADERTLSLGLEVRRRVFVEEQGVAPQLESDGLDASARHVVAWLGDQVIGTARLVIEDRVGRIGRMAVLREHRGQGVGSRLLSALLDVARREGLEGVYVHAQLTAVGFYGRFGFVPEGEEFLEAGIPHIKMVASFDSLEEATS
ncbi:MAG: GNAT family N-acetyltransferase [Firmicutes bacterium]|nr:GNAT family N-acetyltransferase [Bacillota bacterium]